MSIELIEIFVFMVFTKASEKFCSKPTSFLSQAWQQNKFIALFILRFTMRARYLKVNRLKTFFLYQWKKNEQKAADTLCEDANSFMIYCKEVIVLWPFTRCWWARTILNYVAGILSFFWSPNELFTIQVAFILKVRQLGFSFIILKYGKSIHWTSSGRSKLEILTCTFDIKFHFSSCTHRTLLVPAAVQDFFYANKVYPCNNFSLRECTKLCVWIFQYSAAL